MKFAVIPTNGRACLKDCLAAIEPQVDYTILVYTTPYMDGEIRPMRGMQIRDTMSPPNISRWWNAGLNLAEQLIEFDGTDSAWDVAVLNDDVIVPPGWFDAVQAGMRTWDAGAACSGAGQVPVRYFEPGPVPLHTRLVGFAFMLPGEKGLRANEDLHWYFSDDYIDWKAREQGGMVMVSGYNVQHLYPNGQMTPELQVLCAEGAAKFQTLWGKMPW